MRFKKKGRSSGQWKILLAANFLVFTLHPLAGQEKNHSGSSKDQILNQLIRDTQKKFAPDHRVAVFEIASTENKKGVICLVGKTSLPEAKNYLLNLCRDRRIKVMDSIRILPNERLGSRKFALINLSVANLRSQPGHTTELATQALLGMPVNVLEANGGWYRIQTPDDYIAWVDEGGIELVTKEAMNEWLSANKLIYREAYGFSYCQPEAKSQTVSDLVAGDVLRCMSETRGYYEVTYPDNRKAYVKKEDAMPYDEWLRQANPSVENLLATAGRMMGLPYLWGGTSFKGIDCSGFMKTIFFLNGVIIQRDASQQATAGEPINTDESFEKLQPGDLLFFGRKARGSTSERVTHVAIYMGNLQYLNASSTSGRVCISSLQQSRPDNTEYRAFSFIRGKRYLGKTGTKGITYVKDSPYYQLRK